MTAREVMRRRVFRVGIAYICGMVAGTAVCVCSLALGRRLDASHAGGSQSTLVVYGGFALGIALWSIGPLFAFWAIRCPWCHASWPLIGSTSWKLEKVRCCPYCTRMLDEVLASKPMPKGDELP